MTYPRIATLKTTEAFRAHLTASGIPLAFDDRLAAPGASPLAQPIEVDGVRVGNRFCILPMEGLGWDVRRRAERFDAPALASFRDQRRQVDVGRGSRRRSPRWPGESESAVDDAAEPVGDRGAARGARAPHIGIGLVRRRWRSVHRPPADALGALCATRRLRSPGADRGLRTIRCSIDDFQAASGC